MKVIGRLGNQIIGPFVDVLHRGAQYALNLIQRSKALENQLLVFLCIHLLLHMTTTQGKTEKHWTYNILSCESLFKVSHLIQPQSSCVNNG